MRNPRRVRFHAVGYPLAASVPFVVPLVGGLGHVAKVRSLPSARGPGTSVEVAAGPRRWRGVGKCAGASPRRSSLKKRHQPSGNKSSDADCCLSASRRFRQGCTRRVLGATRGRRHVLTICRMSVSPAQEHRLPVGVGLVRFLGSLMQPDPSFIVPFPDRVVWPRNRNFRSRSAPTSLPRPSS
jgi:hypothetical protein